jgi:membrane-bound lytic murein transglycosylase MltF
MFRSRFVRLGVAALALLASLLPSATASAQSTLVATQAPAPPKPQAGPVASLSVERKPWTGDLNAMIQRRVIRVLVPHSKTSYFVERGQPRGIVYDAFKAYEDELNAKRGNLKVNVVFFPTTRDRLVPDLLAGLGDVVAAGFTITTERDKVVDFAIPATTKAVSEIVVTGPQSPQLTSLADLGGKEVFVRKSSSYWGHLEQLSAKLKGEGKPAITLRPAPEDLEDEDLLEMLNAGLFGIAVVDDYKMEVWGKVFPKIKARPDLPVSTGGEIAWAFRPNSPQLKASLDAFLKTHRQGTTFGNTLLKRYLGSTQFVTEARSPEELKKFQAVVEMFQKYAGKYNVDFLLMMAQGYQESRLDQKVKSKVGAVGVMQVMPTTGKELAVGDISQLEPNIHAGVKYMRFMIDRYYKDEPMTPLNKGLFTFASYNAGPARIRQLRQEATKRGLDPNVWFNNVEIIASERIGAETVTYVSNIYKYYVAYKLVVEDMERQKKK